MGSHTRGVGRRARCALNADALAAEYDVRAAVPGAQQLTGGAGPAPRAPHAPPRPARPRAQPVRAPHPSPGPRTRVPSPPLIHYIRTADRFQARSFCPPLHDDRSNLMPFLCPASNAIRLRSASCGSRCSRAAAAAALITDALDNIINKNRAIPPQLNRCTHVQELVKCDTNA